MMEENISRISDQNHRRLSGMSWSTPVSRETSGKEGWKRELMDMSFQCSLFAKDREIRSPAGIRSGIKRLLRRKSSSLFTQTTK